MEDKPSAVPAAFRRKEKRANPNVNEDHGRSFKRVQMDAERAEERESGERKKDRVTGIMPRELERIEAKNLRDRRLGEPRKEDVSEEKRRRGRCRLCYLMTEASMAELTEYTQLALESARIDGIYPLAVANFEPTDVTLAAQSLQLIIEGDSVLYKRAFIWVALFLSREYTNVFCPRPTKHGNKEFTVDPAKLGRFVAGDDATLRHIVSSMLINHITIEQMVTLAYQKWIELQPWRDYETWSRLHADASGGQMAALTASYARREDKRKQQQLADKERAQLLLTAAAAAPEGEEMGEDK